MKRIKSINLNSNEQHALTELRQRLDKELPIEDIILYGSVARGEADQESDIDLLILTKWRLTRITRHNKITNEVFEVNLKYSTNISTLVVDIDSWKNGAVSILPFRDEVLKEGILL